jgi:asparagine synthase (glutamine-hydrolysing)
MFAFALWDRRQHRLLLARDGFGIKPLFYRQTANAFWFASEIKALLMAPDYEPQASLEGLYHFLSFDYVPAQHTAFAGIQELRPGCAIELNDRFEAMPRRFFDIRYDVQANMSEQEAIAGSQEHLLASVKRQLIADVPVGVMLSGGMDSSALASLMSRVRGDNDFHTFSLAFDDASYDESSYAALVAKHIGTHHHHIPVKPERVRELLPVYLAHIDEPYADGSAIPTFLLAECAKSFVTVLLSGEGGDEFFSGYDTHLALKFRRLYRLLPRLLRQGVVKPLVHQLPVSHKKLSLDFKLKRFTTGAEMDVPTSHFAWRVVLDEDVKRQVLAQPGHYQDWPPSSSLFVEAYRRCQADDDLNRLLYIDYSFHLPDDLMIKNDRMTMAHSLEARVPFTDTELVGFLASVPVDLKLKGTRKKHLLREGMRGRLPETILNKKKVGLEMPYSSWLCAEWRDLAEHYFDQARIDATGLFNGAAVATLWRQHAAKQADHGRFLWGMLNYMIWFEHYIQKKDFTSYLTIPRSAR